jgi:hypothetical protein
METQVGMKMDTGIGLVFSSPGSFRVILARLQVIITSWPGALRPPEGHLALCWDPTLCGSSLVCDILRRGDGPKGVCRT